MVPFLQSVTYVAMTAMCNGKEEASKTPNIQDIPILSNLSCLYTDTHTLTA